MKKIVLLIFLSLTTLFGYVNTDHSESTTGTMPASSFASSFSMCSSGCSDVWRYNATITQNLKEFEPSNFYSSKIVNDSFKVKKNLTMTEFVEQGLKFFKEQQITKVSSEYSIGNRTIYEGYNVFMVVREIKDDNNISNNETITKSGNSFSITNTNKENSSVYLNTENVFDSYLFGQIDANTGMVSAYTYRNRITMIKGKKYHFVELEKINFLNSLISKYNEFCSNEENFHFPFIYEPTNFFYRFVYLNTGEAAFNINTDIKIKNNIVYPNSILNLNYYKSGLISMPCKSEQIGDDPYKIISDMEIFLDDAKVTYFQNSGFSKSDLIDNVKYYFYDGGYSLKMATLNEKNILQNGMSFFSGIMQENKIENGVIVNSKPVDIKNKYWKQGKCPLHLNKKTLTVDSELYYLFSLTYDMPFNEIMASFDISNSLKISNYSPISAFPSNEETLYAVTPDNHVLSHSISKNNSVVSNLMNGSKNSIGTDGYTDSFAMTRVYKQKCKSFSLFTLILVIIAVIVTIYSAGLAAGAWGPIMTGASASVPAVGASVFAVSGATVTAGTALLGITAANGLMYALTAGFLAYSFYPNIWQGEDTPPTAAELTNHTYEQIMDAKLAINAISSGSSYYVNFTNLKNTLNKSIEPLLGINGIKYNEMTSGSYYLTKDASNLQILGFSTPSELNHLYAITYSHSDPATLPPKFRYYNYKKVNYEPGTSTSYDFSSVPDYSSSNIMLNISVLENSFLNNMYGYNENNSLNVFKTKALMKNVLETFNKNDFIRYDH